MTTATTPAPVVPFSMYTGMTQPLEITVYDEDGNLFDAFNSGYRWIFTARKRRSHTSELIFQKDSDVGPDEIQVLDSDADPTLLGKILVYPLEGDTINTPEGTYWYSFVAITDPVTGKDVPVIGTSPLTILAIPFDATAFPPADP